MKKSTVQGIVLAVLSVCLTMRAWNSQFEFIVEADAWHTIPGWAGFRGSVNPAVTGPRMSMHPASEVTADRS